MEEVVFNAKYKEWIAVKKLLIDDNTKPEEVAGVLSSIQATLMRKAYDFSGINKSVVEELASKITAGKRKTYPNLAEVFSSMKPGEFKTALLAACPDPKYLPIAESYLLCCVLSNLGFSAYLDSETLMSVFPELKMPKPKGNFGKKKKA